LNFKLGDLPKDDWLADLQKLTKLGDDEFFGTKFAGIA
jgi:hypothetical protein